MLARADVPLAKSAGEQGVAQAWCNLGVVLLHGAGVPANASRGVDCLLRAATAEPVRGRDLRLSVSSLSIYLSRSLARSLALALSSLWLSLSLSLLLFSRSRSRSLSPCLSLLWITGRAGGEWAGRRPCLRAAHPGRIPNPADRGGGGCGRPQSGSGHGTTLTHTGGAGHLPQGLSRVSRPHCLQ
jgi:hypothetical protein